MAKLKTGLAKPQLSVCISPKIIQVVDREAKRLGISRSEAIRQILNQAICPLEEVKE